MQTSVAFRYEVFISYAFAQRDWVDGYLIPSLGLEKESVITKEHFNLGMSVMKELERAVEESRCIVLVLSPNYFEDPIQGFAESLSSFIQVEGHLGRVIPLLKESCALPIRLQMLVSLDCTITANWDSEIGKIRAFLQRGVPEPEHINCPYRGMLPFTENEK